MTEIRDLVGLRATLLARVAIVLIRPSHAGNIGAAARAMRVMGLRDLRVVTPREADFRNDDQALAFASGATDVLAGARAFATLDQALADATLTVAVSAQGRELAATPMGPEAACASVRDELLADPAARAAIVFGTERTGLDIPQAQRCVRLLSIPTEADYGSMNLAQAVQVVAWCLRRACESRDEAWVPAAYAAQEPALYRGFATDAAIEALHAHLERALVSIGFLDPARPKNLMPRLRRLFRRTRLEIEEVDILRGIAGKMEAVARRDRPADAIDRALGPRPPDQGPRPR